MTDTVLLLRTHYVDDAVIGLAERLTAETESVVALAADETQGFVEVPVGLPKVSLKRETLAPLGLAMPPNFAWLCGDYNFYLARRAMPSARHYWLIEHDVLFDLEHMSEFFAHFEAHPEYDFLAGWYQIHGNQWANTAAMLPFADPVYGCLFPVVRVSAAAADHLAVERGRVSEAFLAGHVKIVPNDEAFTASVLTTAGYRCADLNSLGREFYKREEFCFGPPVPRRVFGGVGQPRTGRIHHPVASGETLRRKATEWLYRAPDAMFHSRAATAAEAIRTELGDAVGATFDATVVETAARFR